MIAATIAILIFLLLPYLKAFFFIFYRRKDITFITLFFICITQIAALTFLWSLFIIYFNSEFISYVISTSTTTNSGFVISINAMNLILISSIQIVIIAFILQYNPKRTKSFYVSLFLAEAGLTGALISANMLFFLFSLEILFISVYFLITYRKKEMNIISTGYFIFSQGALLILFITYIYYWSLARNISPSINFSKENIKLVLNYVDEIKIRPSLFMLVTGWLILLPTFPFYALVKDSASKGNTMGTFMLVGCLYPSFYYFFYYWGFDFIPLLKEHEQVKLYIFIVQFVSLFLFLLLSLKERSLKKIFIYLTFIQSPVIFLGFFTGTTTAIIATLYYILFLPISRGLGFLFVDILEISFGTTDNENLKGLFKNYPELRTPAIIAIVSFLLVPLVPFFIQLPIFIESIVITGHDIFYLLFAILILIANIVNIALVFTSIQDYLSPNISDVIIKSEKLRLNNKLVSLKVIALIYIILNIFPFILIELLNKYGGLS